jgi:hypothetical protein
VGIWVGLLKNTYVNTKEQESQKSSTSLNPCFIGGNWVGLLKNTLNKTITKEQHITQLLHRWNCRTVEKYFKTKHKERNHKRAAHTNPCFIGIGRLLKIILRPNTKKGITKRASLNPCFIGGIG